MKFPVLLDYWERRQHPEWLTEVPWELLAPHAAQAGKNHGQSLPGLARRGGLSPLEMLAVLEDRAFPRRESKGRYEEMSAEAMKKIQSLIAVPDSLSLQSPCPVGLAGMPTATQGGGA